MRDARLIATAGLPMEKWFQFGTDRIKAINAAKHLNLEFMRGADLVGAVLSTSSESFAATMPNHA